jgi:hypothetical protein
MPNGWWKLNIVQFFQPRSGGGYYSSFDPATEQIDLAEIDRIKAYREALRHSHSPFTWLTRHEGMPHQIPAFIGAAQNSFALGRTASALERYRLATGRYPGDLAQLVPAFLQSVPHDAIDGQPLRYACADGAHFKLYSIGLNGIDDHGELPGKTDAPGSTSFAWSSKEGDWVWPQSAAE